MSHAGTDENASSRRRRGAGIVTANACTECRKKRSKCDGQTPCARCAAVKAECIYEIPVRQSKETMRAEIELLQTHRRQSERVFGTISSGYKVQETLNRLRNGDTLETIAEWLDQTALRAKGSAQNITTFLPHANSSAFGHTLKMAESVGNYSAFGGSEAPGDHPEQGQTWSPWQTSGSPYSQTTPTYSGQSEDSMNWTADLQSRQLGPEAPHTLSGPLVGVWSPRSPRGQPPHAPWGSGQQQVLGPSYLEQHSSKPSSPGGTWTDVTQDIHLVEHLMALYFCWEYPTFASLSKEHFLADFRAGIHRNCSALLVNAMLALGCRFSDLPESRADPDDSTTSGDHFFAEAKKLLAEDDRCSLTTIQAMGLISIREASYGRDTESFYYAGQAIRLAVEAGLHMETSEQNSVSLQEGLRAATFWGAFSLDQAWSLILGKLPHFSRAAKLIAKPSIIDEVESSEWVPYTDQGIPDTLSANQPSNVRSVYRCFCELSELVHQSLYTLYTPGRRLTANELLAVYTRYLNWYSSLPEALRLGHNFTPSVLFAHMYYHCAILLLFRPFISLRFLKSRVSPRDVCSQAADAILTLVRSYDQLYTLKRTPSFVPYIVLNSCIIHLIGATASSSALNLFRQGAKDLTEMTVCHGFANRGLYLLRWFADHWEMGNTLGEEVPMPAEQIGELCSPSSSSTNFFSPSMVVPVVGDHGPISFGTLFAPFPMQGLPLLAHKDEIERDGFTKSP